MTSTDGKLGRWIGAHCSALERRSLPGGIRVVGFWSATPTTPAVEAGLKDAVPAVVSQIGTEQPLLCHLGQGVHWSVWDSAAADFAPHIEGCIPCPRSARVVTLCPMSIRVIVECDGDEVPKTDEENDAKLRTCLRESLAEALIPEAEGLMMVTVATPGAGGLHADGPLETVSDNSIAMRDIPAVRTAVAAAEAGAEAAVVVVTSPPTAELQTVFWRVGSGRNAGGNFFVDLNSTVVGVAHSSGETTLRQVLHELLRDVVNSVTVRVADSIDAVDSSRTREYGGNLMEVSVPSRVHWQLAGGAHMALSEYAALGKEAAAKQCLLAISGLAAEAFSAKPVPWLAESFRAPVAGKVVKDEPEWKSISQKVKKRIDARDAPSARSVCADILKKSAVMLAVAAVAMSVWAKTYIRYRR